MDNKTKDRRSKNMQAIHSKNTKPEIFVRSALHRLGYRFRLHSDKLIGKPDIVLPKYKVAVFVNGCFWHAHKGCAKSKLPSSNVEFWSRKIQNNVKRDELVNSSLISDGWRVLRVWQCALKNSKAKEDFAAAFQQWINGNEMYGEIPSPYKEDSSLPN